MFCPNIIRAQELCGSLGGRPGFPVLTSLMVSVGVKQHWTVLTHWSQFVPDTSAGHPRTLSSTSSSPFVLINSVILNLACVWTEGANIRPRREAATMLRRWRPRQRQSNSCRYYSDNCRFNSSAKQTHNVRKATVEEQLSSKSVHPSMRALIPPLNLAAWALRGRGSTQTPSTGLRHPSFNHCRI